MFFSIQGEHIPGFNSIIFLNSNPEKLRFMHPAIEIEKHLKVQCTFLILNPIQGLRVQAFISFNEIEKHIFQDILYRTSSINVILRFPE